MAIQPWIRAVFGPLWAVLALEVVGCSADEGATPEPTPTTPGVYLGIEEEQGVVIVRVLMALEVRYGPILFVTVYQPIASDFAQARELAKDRTLPVSRSLLDLNLSAVGPWQVLWYRSPTEAEREMLK
jgi:hypothetical protein